MTVVIVTLVIVTYFSKKNLTPQRFLWCFNLSLSNIKVPAQQCKTEISHFEIFLHTFYIYYDLLLHVHLKFSPTGNRKQEKKHKKNVLHFATVYNFWKLKLKKDYDLKN